MGVRKYRSVADMPGPAALPPLDPENLTIAFALATLAAGFSPVTYGPGVQKFRSWDELVEAREERVRRQTRRAR